MKSAQTTAAKTEFRTNPHEWIAEVPEGEHLHQGADEIEKVVHELQRPPDEGKSVDESARPKEQDGQKRDSRVRPRGRRSF